MGALALHLDADAREREQPRLFAVPGGAATEAPTVREATRPTGRGPASPAAPEVPASDPPAARAAVAAGGAEAPLMPTVLGGRAVRRALSATVSAPRTLDLVVGELFATVATGRQATCLFCGGAVQPRPAATAGVGAGTCGDCGTAFG